MKMVILVLGCIAVGVVFTLVDYFLAYGLLSKFKSLKAVKEYLGEGTITYSRLYLLIQGIVTILMIFALILNNLIISDVSEYKWVIMVAYVLVGMLCVRMYMFFRLNNAIEYTLINRLLHPTSEADYQRIYSSNLSLDRNVGFKDTDDIFRRYRLVATVTMGVIVLLLIVINLASKGGTSIPNLFT